MFNYSYQWHPACLALKLKQRWWGRVTYPLNAIAKKALEAIGNLHNHDIQNVAALTATNSASISSVPSSSNSTALQLESRFLTFNARGATPSRKWASKGTFTRSDVQGNKMGHPNKIICPQRLGDNSKPKWKSTTCTVPCEQIEAWWEGSDHWESK